MKLIYAARSHSGYIREHNEDNLYAGGFSLPAGAESRPFALDGVIQGPAVLAVCDGMGGETLGADASRTAVKVLHNYQDALCRTSPDQLPARVAQYVCQVQETIQADNPGKRVGTTLALAVISKCGVACYNLGDSRIYHWKKGAFVQVTHDHTLGAQRLRQGGHISSLHADQTMDHMLTRCIGIGSIQSPEAYPLLQGPCRLLLCSDGLTRMVDDQSLYDIVSHSATPAQAADRMMALALVRGGRDNITAVVAELQTGIQTLLHKLYPCRRRSP